MTGIVFGTLRRRWLRTLLVGLSTLVAFMLLGFFLAIRHGFAVGPTQVGADLLLLEPVDRASELPLGMLSAVNAFPGVRSVVGVNGMEMRSGANRDPIVVEGLSPRSFLELSGAVRSGELPRPQARAWLTDPTGALVGVKTALKYGWRVGQSPACSAPRFSFSRSQRRNCTQFYGDRTYRARDPEGHVWTFSQTVRQVSRAEAEQASGLKIEAPEWR